MVEVVKQNEKRKSVRGIIIKDNEIFFIHRIKNDEEYYVFPGGGVEQSESDSVALDREMMEELGFVVKPIKTLYKVESKDRIDNFILCKYISGKFEDANGPEYSSEEYKSHGFYEQVSINIKDIRNYNIVPSILRKQFFIDLESDNTLESINLKEYINK